MQLLFVGDQFMLTPNIQIKNKLSEAGLHLVWSLTIITLEMIRKMFIKNYEERSGMILRELVV